jgi:NADH:ubiquinone oxidoreductase subunit D
MQSYLGKRGDSYDRFLIRIREMYESVNIVFQIINNITTSKINFTNNNSEEVNFFNFFNNLYKNKYNKLNKKTKYNSMEELITHFKKYSEGIKNSKWFYLRCS